MDKYLEGLFGVIRVEMNKIPTYLVLIMLVLCSCNNPMSREYSSRSFEDDMVAIRESGKIEEEDITLLVKYALVQNMSGKVPNGETYEDILDRIKSLIRSEKDFVETEQNNEDIKRTRLDPFLDVKVLEKSYSRIDQTDYMIYTIAFRNLSDQRIQTVIGNIRMSDKLEKEIKKIDIVLDSSIEPNTVIKKTFAISYDQYDENDKRVRSKNLLDMRIEWNPDKIIFQTGSPAE